MTLTALRTTTSDPRREPPGRFRIHVRDPLLARALWHELVDLGDTWPAHKVVTVGDEHTHDPLDVLAVPPTPFACRTAVDRAMRGDVAAVVTSDCLDELGPALAGLGGGLVHLPRRVLDVANTLPPLSWRDVEILRGLLIDQSNPGLALRVGVSGATLKRSLGSLMTRMGVANRAALVARGVQLGVIQGRFS